MRDKSLKSIRECLIEAAKGGEKEMIVFKKTLIN